MKLLISLHDVAPFHLARLQKAEALCRELGVRKLSYLLIPDYHGRGCSADEPEFLAWCRLERRFAVEWQLHGFHHLAPRSAPAPRGVAATRLRLKRRLLTAGEGEFLALDPLQQRRRLADGRDVFRRCFGVEPDGFVAPAWLFDPGLPGLLREFGFRFTEDHRRIYSLSTGRQMRCPVITWATRTRLRRYGSLVAGPALRHLWQGEPVLRVALHPFDLDHSETVASIARVLGGLVQCRDQAFAGELDFQ